MADPFLEHRSSLFGIAYRMLGSVAEAEDAVQDVYLRWQKEFPGHDQIRSVKAWLIAATTRLCIDRLRSARRQREEYFGVWLPEPLVSTPGRDPAVALADSLSTAFLLMLESLSPDERAVFLLHEAFEYDYADIAAMLGKSEANCRQILRRAREHLALRPSRRPADPSHVETLVTQFLSAARAGDVTGLLSVLRRDATLTTDGGGQVRAAPAPIAGAERIAKFLVGIRANIPADAEYRFARVNGDVGVVVSSAGAPIAVLTFSFDGDQIAEVYSVSNPDKLRHVKGA